MAKEKIYIGLLTHLIRFKTSCLYIRFLCNHRQLADE